MFNGHHKQITLAPSGVKLIEFRYQTNGGMWKTAHHHCNEYEPVLESSDFIPIYVRISEKRLLKPMYLVLMPSKRFLDIRTYIGFHGLELLNAYLRNEGIEVQYDKLTHNETIELVVKAKIERLLPSDIFKIIEANEWGYTLFYKLVTGEVGQKSVRGFHSKSAAINALRKQVNALKLENGLTHGWRDAAPLVAGIECP